MKTLLCIDDEPSINTLHKMVLEAHGYAVLLADNGAEGLRVLSENPVDLVILDFKMPGMTGAEVAAEIRKEHPSLPILMETAYTNLPDVELKDVDGFLVKGEAPSVLIAEIEALLQGKSRRYRNESRHQQTL